LLFSDVPSKIYLDIEKEINKHDLDKYDKYVIQIIKKIIDIVREVFKLSECTYSSDQYSATSAIRELPNGKLKFSMHVIVLPQYLINGGLAYVWYIIDKAINLIDDFQVKQDIRSMIDGGVYHNYQNM
jgi:hypothetical protein